MTKTAALKIASTLLLSLAALGTVQASTVPADKYGYEFRTGVPADQYGYEFRTHDAFTDGARTGKFDPYADGARTVAGLDKVGVSAPPARTFDPYADGARGADPYTDGARFVAGLDNVGVSASPARGFDPYLDGARA
ncbi:hypothetical protein SAMN05216345_12059 [Cupriavidus sp. YR651]|uniref:hypothetical protein n=1 Tax=Cupriavidus sp. YR651 TaxID=1855315 RepID=UPI0008840FC4|nr:hypothetical protein [Cupriavidus sp. YR651]SDD89554.1 hypothetical protein SAMN05216345_12059 [Cupriavidus sp. YR651]